MLWYCIGITTENQSRLFQDQSTNENRPLLPGVVHQGVHELGLVLVEIDPYRVVTNQGRIGVHLNKNPDGLLNRRGERQPYRRGGVADGGGVN